MTEIRTSTSSTYAATVTLRVAEARVEDVGHAIVRLAPADMQRIGARAGDVLKIVCGSVGVGSAGLQEQVSVTKIEREQAVAVRLAQLWVGAAPATIAPERMLEDLIDVPVMAGSVVRVPTFAKAINFQVVRTIPSGPVVIGKRTDIRIVEGEQTAAKA